NAAPDPARVVLGLSELMLNALEHGNLGISYGEKSALIEQGHAAGRDRPPLGLARICGAVGLLEIRREAGSLIFTVRDQGPGSTGTATWNFRRSGPSIPTAAASPCRACSASMPWSIGAGGNEVVATLTL
ncbi:MAG: hypothetical protein IPJ99_00230, partial [Betaproteobacteria bacterium]|nr:hypothetical protein [Betaproteobacteria bacterium]